MPPDFEVVIVNPSLLLGPGDLRESSTGDVRHFLEGDGAGDARWGHRLRRRARRRARHVARVRTGRPGERYILNAQNLTMAGVFSAPCSASAAWRRRCCACPARARLRSASAGSSRGRRAIGGEPPVDEVSLEMAQYFWYCDGSKAERELGSRRATPARRCATRSTTWSHARWCSPKRSRVGVAHRHE